MAIGSSGRIVIEVDPELKQRLHKLLRENGTNVKEWFTDQAVDYLDAGRNTGKKTSSKSSSAKNQS